MEELFEYKGNKYTVEELAKIAHVAKVTMSARLDVCKTMEEALRPISERGRKSVRKYEYCGEMLTIAELAELGNVSYETMGKRLKKMTPEEALKCKKMCSVSTEESREITAKRREKISMKNKKNKIERYIKFLTENGYRIEKL